jgi:acyl carrier protein
MPEFNTAIDADQVTAVIHEVVRLIAPVPSAAVTDEHRLINDLGFHSLALAELGFTLEDLFSLDTVTPEQAMSLSTVGDISVLISKAVAGGEATLPPVAEVRSFCERYGTAWNPRG